MLTGLQTAVPCVKDEFATPEPQIFKSFAIYGTVCAARRFPKSLAWLAGVLCTEPQIFKSFAVYGTVCPQPEPSPPPASPQMLYNKG